MKKIIFLALTVLILFSFASCLNVTYNYYGDEGSLLAPDVGVITYETKNEPTPQDETDETEVSVQEVLTLPEDITEEETKDDVTKEVTEAEATDEIMTEAPENTPEIPTISLWISHITTPVSSNQTATLVAFGKPFTTYTISVYYTTTTSKAKGLEEKLSDENGRIEWSWKIGASVKTGRYRIVVSGGGETIETEIQVYGQ